jgi:YVTN family beta-propeller protein
MKRRTRAVTVLLGLTVLWVSVTFTIPASVHSSGPDTVAVMQSGTLPGDSGANSTPVLGVVGTANVGQFPAFMAADAANGWVYVTNSGSGTVNVLNGAFVEASLLVGAGTSGLVYDPANQAVYVCNYGANTVSVIDGTTVAVTIPVGSEPELPVYDPGDALVYVPNFGSDTVSVLNSTSVVATLHVGSEPIDATFDSDNDTVYVTNEQSGSETVINGTTIVGNVSTRLVAPFYALFDPVNDFLYVTNYTPTGGTVSAVSIVSGMHVQASFTIGSGPGYPSVDTQNGWVYLPIGGASTVEIINGTSPGRSVGVDGEPTAAEFDAANGMVYVPDDLTYDISVINGTQLSDDIAVGTNPDIATYNPSDGDVYVADSGSGQVSVIGLVTGWAVRFEEIGLPSGTNWAVAVRGVTVQSTTSTVVQYKPNASYYYAVSPLDGYSASPSSGVFSVDGSPQVIPITFSGVSPPTPLGLLGLPTPDGAILIGAAAISTAAYVAWQLHLKQLRKQERIGRLAPVGSWGAGQLQVGRLGWRPDRAEPAM